MSVHLSIPPLGAVRSEGGTFSPEATIAWLDRLDTEPSMAVAEQIVRRLASLNSHRVRVSVRHELSERFYQVVAKQLPAIEAPLDGARVPLPEEVRAAARLADELTAALAASYKILLIELSRRLFGLASSGRALLPVHRTMELLARRMMNAYRIYSSAPKGVWEEMHELYRFATRRGLAERTLTGHGDTPTRLYKKALLVAFADPQRLNHGDLATLTALIEAHVDRSIIAPWRGQATDGGTFIIKHRRDAPGAAITRHRNAAFQHDDLVFNAGPVARMLGQEPMAGNDGSLDSPTLPGEASRANMLRTKLIRQWGSTPVRRMNRLRTHARVEILVGIDSIWSFLSNVQDAPDPRPGWIVTNESPSGFALMFTGHAADAVVVGDVVGLRSTDMRGCHVCVVRWVLSDNPEHIELGLEEIAPSARPAMLRPLDGEIQPLQTLLLPDSPTEASGPTLITPVAALDSPCELSIGAYEAKVRVAPSCMTERTNNVQIIRFAAA